MKNIIEKIRQKAESTAYSGVISIFRNGITLFSEAFGYRNIAEKLPNNTETRFGIASGTKLFTALGIGVLIEQKKICLDTKMEETAPEFCTFIDGKATVEQLLCHTSGIYDYYDEEIFDDSDNFFVEIPWYRLETPSDYLPLFKGKIPKFSPGERFSYSNGGYVFLGVLIEKLSDRKYREFIDEYVLKPAGMNNSGFFAANSLPSNTAAGYTSDRVTSNIFILPVRGGGDGGMYTTTDDLCSFWDSFFGYKILSEKLTREFLKTRTAANQWDSYGLGICKHPDDSVFHIVGGDAGVGFDSRYLPGEGILINLLSNITDGENEMRSFVFEILDEIKDMKT